MRDPTLRPRGGVDGHLRGPGRRTAHGMWHNPSPESLRSVTCAIAILLTCGTGMCQTPGGDPGSQPSLPTIPVLQESASVSPLPDPLKVLPTSMLYHGGRLYLALPDGRLGIYNPATGRAVSISVTRPAADANPPRDIPVPPTGQLAAAKPPQPQGWGPIRCLTAGDGAIWWLAGSPPSLFHCVDGEHVSRYILGAVQPPDDTNGTAPPPLRSPTSIAFAAGRVVLTGPGMLALLDPDTGGLFAPADIFPPEMCQLLHDSGVRLSGSDSRALAIFVNRDLPPDPSDPGMSLWRTDDGRSWRHVELPPTRGPPDARPSTASAVPASTLASRPGGSGSGAAVRLPAADHAGSSAGVVTSFHETPADVPSNPEDPRAQALKELVAVTRGGAAWGNPWAWSRPGPIMSESSAVCIAGQTIAGVEASGDRAALSLVTLPTGGNCRPGDAPTSIAGTDLWWVTADGVPVHSNVGAGTADAFVVSNEPGLRASAVAATTDGAWLATNHGIRRLFLNKPDPAAGYAGFVRAPLGEAASQPARPWQQRLARMVEEWRGTPYLWGGSSRKGVDCSGYVLSLYGQLGVSLPHRAREIGVVRQGVVVRDELRYGDVLVTPPHCGVYIGNGRTSEAVDGGVGFGSLWSWKGATIRRFLDTGHKGH